MLAYAAKSIAYTSTAQVDVEAHVVANTTPVAPNMATEKRSLPPASFWTASPRNSAYRPVALGKDLKAAASGTSNILSISCTMPAQISAQRCAAAAASGYIAFRNATGSPAPPRATIRCT